MITRINFQCIPVTDQDRAIGFYRDMLGFEVHTDAPYTDDWRWIFMAIPGAQTRLQFSKPGELEIKSGPALCLVCDDVDAECEILKSKGTEITDGPGDAPWAKGVRWAMIRDTENNLILLESFKE